MSPTIAHSQSVLDIVTDPVNTLLDDLLAEVLGIVDPQIAEAQRLVFDPLDQMTALLESRVQQPVLGFVDGIADKVEGLVNVTLADIEATIGGFVQEKVMDPALEMLDVVVTTVKGFITGTIQPTLENVIQAPVGQALELVKQGHEWVEENILRVLNNTVASVMETADEIFQNIVDTIELQLEEISEMVLEGVTGILQVRGRAACAGAVVCSRCCV